jgi:hypothetical protein
MRISHHFSLAVLVVLTACSCSSPPAQSTQTGSNKIDTAATELQPAGQPPQRRQVARDFSIGTATNGARHEVIIILTNAQLPVVRAIVTVTQERKYQFITIASDGQQRPAIVGIVPDDVYAGVAAEVRERDADGSRTDGAVYIAPQDAKHPAHLQRLLEYLTK